MNHPLEHFQFCPVCGSSHWAEHNFKSKHCADCGFTYYANPCSATAAFILRPAVDGSGQEELLVVRRGKEPAKGTLDLPGGFVDMGETGEQGMMREILEETGLQVPAVEYLFSIPNLYMYSGMEIHTLDMFFRVHVAADVVPHAADDAEDCQWIPLADVRAADFGLQSISQAVARYLAACRSGTSTGQPVFPRRKCL